MRTILFTGKGGVGKTTIAAATALQIAASGQRTLVVSTDAAHSLADSFDVPLGDQPVSVGPNCWAQQLDARLRFEASWGDIQSFLTRLFEWAGIEGLAAEELAVVPGMEEIISLVDVLSHARSGSWDAVVVDCAPTAETIRLLSLPDVLSWYMDRLFPTSRRVTRVVGPMVSRMAGGMPIADPAVFAAFEELYHQLRAAKEFLCDPTQSSVRVVMTAERMVIAEARRTLTYLSLFGYPVDAVVVNRLFPDEVTDRWFDQWRDDQTRQLDEIEWGFSPLPILRSELAPSEVMGVAGLEAFGRSLYGDIDPAGVLATSTPTRIDLRDREPVIELDLPHAEKSSLEVARIDDDLVVTVGPYRRVLALPDSLRHRQVVGAGLNGGTLRVSFGHHEGDGVE